MKQKFKMILDIIMLLMMITFFNKSLFGMKYHEVAGLILIAIVIVHIVINVRTITAMCKKFIKVPAEIKVGVIIDILLVICFAWIGISGIFISKTILTEISSNNMIFKIGHMFGGGLSFVLLGVHIGLHIYRKPLSTIAAVVISAVFLCGGIYGVVKSSEVRWLTAPISIMANSQENTGGGKQAEGHNSEGRGKDVDRQKTSGSMSDKQEEVKNNAEGGREGGMPSLPLTQKAESILMFLSMILSCTMITYWIVLLKKYFIKRKQNN